MRVDLTINDVLNDWVFNGERTWKVKYNGKTYSFISPHKPVIGSYIPCDVTERAAQTKDGKPITYRDARPIPKAELAQEAVMAADNVPNFRTPSHDVLQEMRGVVRTDTPTEQPQTQDPGPETPEWAKPGPKPKLIGVEVIIDTLKNHFTDQEKEGMNFWQGFFSLAATVCRDFNDGKLEIDYLTVEDKERLT